MNVESKEFAQHQLNLDSFVFTEPELAEFIPTFLGNRYKDLQSLHLALEGSDWVALKRMGHSLKGMCQPYGFVYLGELGKQIEEAAVDEDTTKMKSLIETYETFLDEFVMIRSAESEN